MKKTQRKEGANVFTNKAATFYMPCACVSALNGFNSLAALFKNLPKLPTRMTKRKEKSNRFYHLLSCSRHTQLDSWWSGAEPDQYSLALTLPNKWLPNKCLKIKPQDTLPSKQYQNYHTIWPLLSLPRLTEPGLDFRWINLWRVGQSALSGDQRHLCVAMAISTHK